MSRITDLSYLEMVSDGDKEFITQVVTSFIENNKEIIEGLENGKKEENWEEMGKLIHKMKPSLEMVGLTPLKEKIIQAETNLKNGENIPETLPLVDEIIANCNQAIEELQADL
jgi:HPt (histidine-containing phosphotransfer) domain-containing protein